MKLNQMPSNPSLKDLLDLFKKDIFLNMNVHHIGTVQSFDAENQTATVTINYKKTRFELNKATGLYNPVLLDYPLLVDSPVVVLGGGPTALTFPIKQGDECLVIFNDRDLDNWFQGNTGGAVGVSRYHSFSDAIILVGLRSLANTIDNYDETRAVLRYGQTQVGVGETLIKIANATTTLNTLLQDLVDEVKNLADQTAALTVTGISSGGQTSGPPSNALAITAISLQLAATASDIAGLLE